MNRAAHPCVAQTHTKDFDGLYLDLRYGPFLFAMKTISPALVDLFTPKGQDGSVQASNDATTNPALVAVAVTSAVEYLQTALAPVDLVATLRAKAQELSNVADLVEKVQAAMQDEKEFPPKDKEDEKEDDKEKDKKE